MPELCPHQMQCLEQILASIRNRIVPASILLIGPSGAGKKTIAREAARRLEMSFEFVSLDLPVDAIADELFGTFADATRSTEGGPAPGVLGHGTRMMLYLAGLQNAQPPLLRPLYRLLTDRTYLDKQGNIWAIGENILIVAALSTPVPNPTVSHEHWLCTGFQLTIRVNVPSSQEDLLHMCKSMASMHAFPREVKADVGAFLSAQLTIPQNLHSVRRWLNSAFESLAEGTPVSAEALQRAMGRDLEWILPRVTYRGRQLTIAHFSRWAGQFPKELSTIPIHLARLIADRYYLSMGAFYEALERLIRESGVPEADRVAFLKWQHLGQSAPAIAHDLKNQARWRIVGEIDLDQDERLWPDLTSEQPRWFILADDFVGSGTTMTKLFSDKRTGFLKLLHVYPESEVRVLIVCGFEAGLRAVRAKSLECLRHRVRLLCHWMLSEKDTCFHRTSCILTDDKQRDRFRRFCLEAARRHFPTLKRQMHLGYADLGAFVAFFNTVPNNSLPILWHDTGTWYPLFPASGIPQV